MYRLMLSSSRYIRKLQFLIDFYMLPISGADIVLGTQWLKMLGPIILGYAALSMQFQWLGSQVFLQGIRNNRVSEISPSQLKDCTILNFSGCFHLDLSLTTTTDPPSSYYVDPTINAILKQFNELFREPIKLSLERSTLTIFN